MRPSFSNLFDHQPNRPPVGPVKASGAVGATGKTLPLRRRRTSREELPANKVIMFYLAESVTVSVTPLADLAGVVAAGVASSADLAGDATVGVASSGDLAGDATIGVASPTVAEVASSAVAEVAYSAVAEVASSADHAEVASSADLAEVASSADLASFVTLCEKFRMKCRDGVLVPDDCDYVVCCMWTSVRTVMSHRRPVMDHRGPVCCV